MNYRSWDSFCRRVCVRADKSIKNAPWFPVDTGYMRDSAVYCAPMYALKGVSAYSIKFDGYVAPYIQYNEEGTRPHNIPYAFGYPFPFGIGGHFNGMFHSGSDKNVGFISSKAFAVAIIETKNELHRMKIRKMKRAQK